MLKYVHFESVFNTLNTCQCIHWDKTQMLKKKYLRTKKVPFFLRVPTHYSFTFNLWFLYELMQQGSSLWNCEGVFPFLIPLLFPKMFTFYFLFFIYFFFLFSFFIFCFVLGGFFSVFWVFLFSFFVAGQQNAWTLWL